MSLCPRCQTPFICGMSDAATHPDAPCWCTTRPVQAHLPLDPSAQCLCPACLDASIARTDTPSRSRPEGADAKE